MTLVSGTPNDSTASTPPITPPSTPSNTPQGVLLVGRNLDEDEWALAVANGERPRHYVFDLARQCNLTLISPVQSSPRRKDRVLGLLIGRAETWALARAAIEATPDGEFVYATDESIGIPYILLASKRRKRTRNMAMFVLAPERSRTRFWFSVLRRLKLLPSTLIAGVPETAQGIRDRLGSNPASVDVVFLPVTVDDQFFTPGVEPIDNPRPLVISAGLEQRDYKRLAEATRDLDVDVDVCAVSPDRAGATVLPDVLPSNMQLAPLSISGLRDLYQRADLFVLSTVPNTMGAGLSAVMESLASGLDVVVSIHEPDLADLVADGLVRRTPDTSAESLKDAIEEVLAERRDRERHATVRLTADGYVLRLARFFAANHGLVMADSEPLPPIAAALPTDPNLLSVVIPVANADDRLAVQLKALFDQTAQTEFEVIISHNMPTDADRDRLTEVLAPFDNESLWVIESKGRASAAHARNAGAAAARGELLAFCDADDVVHDGWIDAMAKGLESHDAVTGAIVEIAPEGQADWRPAATPGHLPTFHGAPYVLSGNLGIRRAAFNNVGGFDESLTRCEDIAIGWALQNRGHDIAFAPDAILDYHHRAGLRKMLVQHYLYGRGMAEVLSKYPNPLHAEQKPDSASRRLALLKPNAQPHRRTVVSEMRRVAIGVGRVVGLVTRR
jgi:GT2 family glycosyltransferase